MRISACLSLAYAIRQAHAINGTLLPGHTRSILLSAGTEASQFNQTIPVSIKLDETISITSSRSTTSKGHTTHTASHTSIEPNSSQVITSSNSTRTSKKVTSEGTTMLQTAHTTADNSVSGKASSLELPRSLGQVQSNMNITSSTMDQTSQDVFSSTSRSITSETERPSSSTNSTPVAVLESSSTLVLASSSSLTSSLEDLILTSSLESSSDNSGTASASTSTSDALTTTLKSSTPSRINDGTGSLRVPTATEDSSTTLISTAGSSGSITITSTMTAMPTSVSMESRTDLTTNTWITTSQPGSESSTIVPVVWCPDCGSKGLSVVVWNFPPLPSVVFSWPGLPTFQFPCIPLPFKPCSTPPKTDTEHSKGEDKENEDDDDKEDEDKAEPSTSSETSSTKQSDSCTTTTASECFVACSAFLTRREADVTQTRTTKCYTTKCRQTAGCSATSITPTSITTATSAHGPSCAFDTATNYNAKASYEAMGISVPKRLQEPLTAVETSPSSGKAKVTDANSGNDATTTSVDGSMTDFLTPTAVSTMPSSRQDSKVDQTSSTTSSSVISSTSTRSSTSSVKTTSNTSATPTHSVKDAVCREQYEFPDHGAVQPDMVRTKSANFCVANFETTLHADSDPIRDQSEESGVSYDYKIEWIEDCTLESSSDGQSTHYPTGLSDSNRDCYRLFDKAFACNNGGIGDYVDVDCLRYTFTGAEFTTEEDPENPDDDSTPEFPSDTDSDSVPEQLQPQTLQCHSLDDFHRKDDVKRKAVRATAARACEKQYVLDVPHPMVYTEALGVETGFAKSHVVSYLYTFEWIPNCIGGFQTTQDPAGSGEQDACQNLFLRTYDECTGNEGIGGSIDVGCLRYTFHGGLDGRTKDVLAGRGGSTNGIAIAK